MRSLSYSAFQLRIPVYYFYHITVGHPAKSPRVRRSSGGVCQMIINVQIQYASFIASVARQPSRDVPEDKTSMRQICRDHKHDTGQILYFMKHWRTNFTSVILVRQNAKGNIRKATCLSFHIPETYFLIDAYLSKI